MTGPAQRGRAPLDEVRVWKLYTQGVASKDIATRTGWSQRSVNAIVLKMKAVRPEPAVAK